MLKAYPESIQLRVRKCPRCGAKFEAVEFQTVQDEIDAVCPNPACEFRVELFWIHGYAPPSSN